MIPALRNKRKSLVLTRQANLVTESSAHSEAEINSIYGGVEAETRKSQASFQII